MAHRLLEFILNTCIFKIKIQFTLGPSFLMGVTLPCRDIFDSCSLEVGGREWSLGGGGGEGAGTTGIY